MMSEYRPTLECEPLVDPDLVCKPGAVAGPGDE
jgi:hypothetical protein